jgi:hypothetical protein
VHWFVNYWHHPCRETSLNLAVARVSLASLGAWKVIAYPFGGVAAYPNDLVAAGAPGLWTTWPQYGVWIGWEQALAVGCLVSCACGLASGLTAVAAAALISHLTAVAWPVCMEKTWLPLVYFLLLYGVFRDEDRHVLWPVPQRGLAADSPRAGAARGGQGASLRTLQWFLATLALIYFFAGLHKLEGGGWTVEWAGSVNMSRMLEERALCRGNPLPPLGAWLQGSPAALRGIGLATISLELGLLVAVLTNRFLTLCLLGLAAMHLSIWATMRVNYFTDLCTLYLVFVPWDTLVEYGRRFLHARPRIDGTGR